MRRWATLYLKLWNSPGTIFIFLISKCSALFDLLESFLTIKSPEGCVIFSERWWLFRKASLASSTGLEALVYSSEIYNGSSFQSWETDHKLPPRLSSSGKRWRICGLGHRFNPNTMQSEARLHTILNSGTVLEQFSSSFSPSAVHSLIYLNPSSGRKAVLEKIVAASDNKKKYHTKAQKATLYLKLWNSPGTIFFFLFSKRSALFDLLESFLTAKSLEGVRASQLACRPWRDLLLFFLIIAYICRGDADGDAEYSLLVNLKRLDDDLQLSRQISMESLHNCLAETPTMA
ncbi:hypothetical protein MTR67_052189 [Solanum verrucosum]|uniref:Uncharacterized protein n=1 Tax=Solanum verrucosum TaxID=315347 RepID=A0AAF1A3B6_SOLVR|nr:hypothetical protein MTR67_052189 [Solanum verrucosum]